MTLFVVALSVVAVRSVVEISAVAVVDLSASVVVAEEHVALSAETAAADLIKFVAVRFVAADAAAVLFGLSIVAAE